MSKVKPQDRFKVWSSLLKPLLGKLHITQSKETACQLGEGDFTESVLGRLSKVFHLAKAMQFLGFTT